jgi:Tol biopolymer transport system component
LQGQPFTTWPGYEQTPSFSPDGSTIAFAAQAIYSQRIGSDQAVRLTHSSQPEIDPVWSPDGLHIAFLRQEKGERLGVYVMPANGSDERRVSDIKGRASSGRLDWSRNGRFLATSDTDGDHAPRLVLISAETGSRQWITEPQPGDVNDWCPVFSPDGKTVAFVRQAASNVQDIYLMPIQIGGDGKAVSGPARRLTFGNHQLYGHAWSADGQSILFASRPSGSLYGIWRIAASGGEPVRVSSADADARQPSIARNGSRMAYVCQFVDMNIWRAAVDGQTAARPLIASTLYDTDPQYSPDGKRIAFRSDRSGNDAIWVSEAASGDEPSRVADLHGPPLGPPRWSPDGRLLAFDSRQDGRSVIYVVPADGKTAPHPITSPQRSNSMLPNWSHDGNFLYFGSNRSGRWQVWKQPVSGDSAEQLTTQGGFSAFEMADGRSVYYSKSPSIPGIWKLPGEELAMPSASAPKWGWMPGRNGIYFIEAAADEEQPAGIRYFDFTTKKARLLGHTSAKPALGGTGLSISPDERWMAYAQVDRAGSDIILVQNFH